MNYYLIRDCPYPVPITGDVIGFDRVTAEQWDVLYIMSATKTNSSGALYQNKQGTAYYIQPTDKVTFDMLHAFGIPHIVGSDNFSIIRPQVIANFDGTRTVTIDKNTKDKKGPKGQAVIYPALHMLMEDDPSETVDVKLSAPSDYALRVGDLLIMPDNTAKRIIR